MAFYSTKVFLFCFSISTLFCTCSILILNIQVQKEKKLHWRLLFLATLLCVSLSFCPCFFVLFLLSSSHYDSFFFFLSFFSSVFFFIFIFLAFVHQKIELYLLPFINSWNLTKGYWMRNNQNGGWKWNENLYSINKIQYLPVAWRK